MTERVTAREEATSHTMSPAAALAMKIEGDMSSLQHGIHNGKVLQALQNDADRLRQAGAQPNGLQFTQLVQKNLQALNCLPWVEISQSHGSIQFDMRINHTEMPSHANQKPLTKIDIYQAQFTPGKQVEVDHQALFSGQAVYPKNDSHNEQHR